MIIQIFQTQQNIFLFKQLRFSRHFSLKNKYLRLIYMALYCSDQFECSDNDYNQSNIQMYNDDNGTNQQMALYQNHGTSQSVKMKQSQNKVKVSIKDKQQMCFRQDQSDQDSQRIQNTFKVSQTQYSNPYNGQNQVVTKYKVTQKSRFN
ncbi:unnamed protein product [Paramecium octaurelia]|uniref:Uncharacterized protein n=1 Tax=Paramecium octaurelia TaxID=43137 RepID=A0A8S1X802_PAROT|nr:unnamed protein product [Paramecium octaurelia]